jgi:hypothetical protein
VPPFDARHGLRDDNARKQRGSGEAAGPPPSVQSAVEEKSSGCLGEESERKTERRVRGERDMRGWAVRGFMVRATKRRGVSRSSPGVQAKPHVVPSRAWPRGNARFGGILRACVEAALWASKMRKPRNPINGLLTPQVLVRLFAGY